MQWSQAGHRGAWLHIPQSRAELIEIAVAAKFVFHHVDVDRGELALSRWLARDEPNALPPFASSYLGIGALVLNERGEVVVLTERYGRGPDFWKLPGGAVDRGEDLHAAAAREVREECGIDADFICLLSLRQLHQYRWQCSDLYFVCLMRARDSSQVRPLAWPERGLDPLCKVK